MKAVLFDRCGPPLEVLRVADVAMPAPRDGEALVRMVAASVSPGDFLFVEGLYPDPKTPILPGQIAGNHGAGIVERAPPGSSIAPGTLVAFSYYDSWAEYAAVPVEWLIPLPAGFAPEKAAQFFNLITAWDLLAAARAGEGDWIVVTAGNSTVSTMVAQFAAARGIRVIALSRRPRADLTRLGATAVVDLGRLDGPIGAAIAALTGGEEVAALIDNVGGPVTGDIIRAMRFGGQVVINGGMSAERFELHNFDVLLKGLEIRSHVYRYFFAPPAPADQPELARIAEAAAGVDFQVAVGGMRPLDDWQDAVRLTIEAPEAGKQFFAPRVIPDGS